MDQWGVGRRGYDDGLVIMFDMEYNLRHGQVSLYAGSGFKAAYLTNAERQAIFDDHMMPRSRRRTSTAPWRSRSATSTGRPRPSIAIR